MNFSLNIQLKENVRLMPEYDYAYPSTSGISHRDRRILLLQHQQRILKESSPTEDMLRFQQRVLRERLLAPSPRRDEKIGQIQQAQHILKDMERTERQRLQMEKKLKDRLKKSDEKIRGRIIKEKKNVGRHPFY